MSSRDRHTYVDHAPVKLPEDEVVKVKTAPSPVNPWNRVITTAERSLPESTGTGDDVRPGPPTLVETEDLSQYNFQPNLGARPGGTQVAGEGDPSQVGVTIDSGASPRPTIYTEVSSVLNEDNIMDEHDSYHQSISAAEAKRRLKKCARGDRSYLTRYSQSNQKYMLSVYQKKPTYEMKHFPIAFFKDGDRRVYKIEGKTMEHDSLANMLVHYETNRIDPGLRDIGRCVTQDEYTSLWCTIL